MQSVCALLLSFAALAAAAPAEHLPRAVSQDNSKQFQIYAYGSGIGGLSMFSAGGSDAYFGDHTKFNDSNAAPVIFTPTNNNVWLGAPNTTALNSTTPPDWSNLTFSVPADGASSHDVGFVNSTSTSSDRRTSGFVFYGTFILVQSSSGGMESMWYATPSSIDGIYTLKWNETGDSTEDKIVLTLKKTPPSNASKTKARDA
ncbi:uncharacterized protein ColSpa_06067 [Colletotrichum spaethianum]|uniref:Cytochrome P450 n=1 Tax=Colletotrichum spaethianum TaxID=700344 RepID=A0AA37LCK8_9PEZI|nr:uncharacterized protein ColSpa_06067 [Colletotrichum spaethianum]GKT45886.1 hypothetical protein ColSpa_06067 [Colletotrichum spaethianum]